jgi:hypothetical protein
MNGLKSLLLVLFAAVTISSFSTGVEFEDAATVARTFMYERLNQYHTGADYTDISVADWWEAEDAFYVFNLNEGWIIISKRYERSPVIAYNFDGSFPQYEKLPDNIKGFLQTYIDEAHYIISNKIRASLEAEQSWHYYLTNDHSSLSTEHRRDVASPLLTTRWNQNYPYNIYCPEEPAGPGGRVYVGCVATAMSMVMHYWRYPLQGQGQHQYWANNYGWQTVNYGETDYNWNGMQDVINYSNLHDVALLGYHAAVSVEMMFGPNGSGAYSEDVPHAMKTFFAYSDETHIVYKSDYTNAQWENILQTQLDAGQPMYYSGCNPSVTGCHAFVCDGYQGTNFYHFNLGWGGSSNGWYNLETTGGFPVYQAAVINLSPADPEYPYLAEGLTELNTYSGSFSDGSGPVENYPAGISASWLINPQSEGDSISSINLKFIKFHTADSDFVKVYDGASTDSPLLAEFSGSELPPTLTIPNSVSLVTFSGSSPAPGFVAEYITTIPVWCYGTSVLTETAGIIDDGSGPFNYNSGANCFWIILVPDAYKYTLSFNKFSTEAGNDILRILKKNNQLVAELSGNTTPAPIEIQSEMVVLAWSTNSSVNDIGWEISYTTELVNVSEEVSITGFSVFPSPADEQIQLGFSLDKPQDVKISIIDITGKEVYAITKKQLYGNQNPSIPLAGIDKGVYLLILHGERVLMTKKVVVR